ncbi:MAG: BON domain-containing protein [Thermomicrobiaceae bacterium]
MRYDFNYQDYIPDERRSRRRGYIWGLLTGLVIGAAAMFALDPQNGRRRRSLARDKAIKARNTIDQTITEDIPRRAEYFSGFAEGAVHRAKEMAEGGSDRRPESEPVLVDRVMSSVFRDPELPKGDINVDANGTTIFLRGSVESDEISADIEKRVRAVEGVDDVVNLINQPEADPSEARSGE